LNLREINHLRGLIALLAVLGKESNACRGQINSQLAVEVIV
jgi:hypothetical protein